VAFLLKKCYKVAMSFSKRVQGYVALIGIAAVAALLAAVGCGGGDDPPSGSGSAAAREEGGGGDGAQGGGEAASEEEGGGFAAGGAGSEGAGTGSAGGGSNGGEGAGGGGSKAGGGNAGKAGLQGRSAKGGSGGKRKPSQSTGGGSSGGGGGADDSSFFASADSICRERRKDTRQNLNDYTGKGLTSLAKNSGKIVNELVIPNLEGEMSEIRALNPPASVQGAVNALFGWIEKMIAAGKEDPEAFLLSSELVAESEEAAKQNGFNICGGI
jgi:hypothetical protein